MSARVLVTTAIGAAGLSLFILLFVVLPRYYGREPQRAPSMTATAASAPAAPAPPGRKIKAHLYYVSEDGMRLTRVERDVPLRRGFG